MIEINKIYNEDCLLTMKNIPENYIDLTVTSPPYDNLRDYHGYVFNFEMIAKELYRVSKAGGVVVWICGDSVIKGSETGTSLKQALYFKEMGFTLHDTMIYYKNNFSNPSKTRYHQIFEYMFIVSKGTPKTFNPIIDRKNIFVGGNSLGRNTKRQVNGNVIEVKKSKINKEFGMRYNIWKGNTAGQENMCKQQAHPAAFPLWLVTDHILSWSNPDDIVYDPMAGGGTTAVACKKTKRNWIMSEISKEYCDIIKQKIGEKE